MAFLIDDMLLAPIKLVQWLGQKVDEAARHEMTDESRVNERLMEIQILRELGDLTEQDYTNEETRLMKELETIRRLKEQGL